MGDSDLEDEHSMSNSGDGVAMHFSADSSALPTSAYDGDVDFSNSLLQLPDEKRAHHNALERKRRDHIKDSFTLLKEVIPSIKNEKASRATILRKAADYISFIKSRNRQHEKDIAEIERQNAEIEAQIRTFEQAHGIAPAELDPDDDEVMEIANDADDRIDGLSSSDPNLANFYQQSGGISGLAAERGGVNGLLQPTGAASRKWSAPARYISVEALLSPAELSQQQQHIINAHCLAKNNAAERSGSDSTISICDTNQ